MSERLHVKPARAGDVLRDPGHPSKRWSLPAEGALVPDNTFWRRRLISGDVIRVEPSNQPATQPRAVVQQKASEP